MHALRIMAYRYRLLAAVLLVLALAIKAVVPMGYMPVRHGTVLTIEICADATSGGSLTRQIVVPSDPASGQGKTAPDKASSTCPYAALGLAMLAGANAVLLALALAYILSLGLAPTSSIPLRRIAFLRPPLRGPPAPA